MGPMQQGTLPFDFIVIGAGIAGASAAYWLAPHGRVLILERESAPGYHSTGRSAALYMASYGSEQVRALTKASYPFFSSPPPGFASQPLLAPRGALMVATPEQMAGLKEHWEILKGLNPEARWLSVDEACAMVPALRTECIAGAVYEPDAADMDVNAIHDGYLRGVKRHGGTVICDAEITLLKYSGGEWLVQSGDRSWQAPVVLNAAGAWADLVGQMAGAQPIGLVPKRRAAFVFRAEPAFDVKHWPMVYSAGEDWYLKPDAGVLLGSPANADPVHPHDVQPEELDIATGIFHIEEMTSLSIQRPIRTWAGLRSFVSDSGLVGGMDPQAPGFCWVAAQGGYGIQTSAAMGETCAALARGLPVPPHIAAYGVTQTGLSPQRLMMVQNQ